MLFTPISEEEAEEDAKFIALRNQHFELRRNVCTSTTWCSLDTVAESFINIDGPVEYSSLNDYLYFSVQKPGWQDMTKLIISEFLQVRDPVESHMGTDYDTTTNRTKTTSILPAGALGENLQDTPLKKSSWVTVRSNSVRRTPLNGGT